MSRTLEQLVIDLETILECKHGDVAVEENFESYSLDVTVAESAIAESMFTEREIGHIIDSLTPRRTGYTLEVGFDE